MWCATSRWCMTARRPKRWCGPSVKSGTVFGVTYNYTGYPMVREARHLVRTGVLGEVRKVTVEYNQGWLATAVEGQGNKQAGWRLDPARSGKRRHHGRHRLACGKSRRHRDGAGA
jgi:predicted dehydrogenase